MLNKLAAAQNRRASIVKALTAINDRATQESRLELTAEEQARYTSLETLLAETNREIAEGEAARQAELQLPRVADPYGFGPAASRPGRPAGRRYAELFGAESLSSGGWESSREFFAMLHSGLGDSRLVPMATGLHEGKGSTGGFAVPEQFAAEWLDASLENEIVRPRATIWPMTSDTRKVPGWDVSTNAGTLFGGFSCQWLGEKGSATDSDPALKLLELKARKLGLFTKASNELVADGMGIDQQIESVMQVAIGWSLDYAFLRGTGAGQPLGVLNAPSLAVVAKEVGQAADSILYANLVKMFARLHPSCLGQSVWVANTTCIPQLCQLSVTIGVGGAHIPVMTTEGGRFTILTRPVLFTEKLPVVGDEGDIILCDFSQYAVGMRKEVSVERSVHVGWQTDELGFRAILRGDGQPTWPSTRTPKHGDALSWCVALAAR